MSIRRFQSAGLAATLWMFAGLAMLAGCGERKEPEVMKVEDTVFAEQVETIERTEERVQQMEGRMQDLNRELEASEGANAREDDADSGN